MVPSEEMSSLALYLEKQREARRLTEELEQLKSSQTVEAAIRIKHEIEALMADYELTPEQLLEALCMLFDLAKPVGFIGSDLTDASQRDVAHGDKKAGIESNPPSSGDRSDRARGKAGRKQGKEDSASRTGRSSPKASSNQSLVPAKKVTIMTQKEREAAGKTSTATSGGPARKKTRQKKKAGPSISAPARARRAMKLYINPHTGEVVKTRGANHRVLNQWRARYGQDVVDTWWEYEKTDTSQTDSKA